jgi:hypothetical protein
VRRREVKMREDWRMSNGKTRLILEKIPQNKRKKTNFI